MILMGQCSKCGIFDECQRVWKNPEAEFVTCVGYIPKRLNADWVRSLDNEGLAWFISTHASECIDGREWTEGCVITETVDPDCIGCWLRWLTQEYKEGEHEHRNRWNYPSGD